MERDAAGLIIATTPQVEGRPVREYLGIVGGEAALPVEFVPARAKTGARRAHARATSFERRVQAARERALAAMADAALELGASAVVAVEVRCTTVRRPVGRDLLIVTATGTAVTL